MQEFLDSYIQLPFKLQLKFLQPEQDGIFFPSIIVLSGQQVERLIQKTLMEKCYLNLGILAFLYSTPNIWNW